MTIAEVVLCWNQGGLEYLGLLFFHLVYLNVLMYANWAGLIVDTNFHLGGEGGLSLSDPTRSRMGEGGVYMHLRGLNCIAPLGSAPRQWIVLSQPAVLGATKARQAQRKCATAAHSLRYPLPLSSKPLCAAWGAATTTVGRGAQGGGRGGPKRRTGGQKGGKGGQPPPATTKLY